MLNNTQVESMPDAKSLPVKVILTLRKLKENILKVYITAR